MAEQRKKVYSATINQRSEKEGENIRENIATEFREKRQKKSGRENLVKFSQFSVVGNICSICVFVCA